MCSCERAQAAVAVPVQEQCGDVLCTLGGFVLSLGCNSHTFQNSIFLNFIYVFTMVFLKMGSAEQSCAGGVWRCLLPHQSQGS